MGDAAPQERAAGALTTLVPGLTPDEVERLLAATRPVELPADFTLLREGDHSDMLYVIAKGTLRASRDDGDMVVELGELGPGEWVGEISVLDPGPTTATVRSVTRVEVRAISADRLRQLRDEDPQLAGKLLRELSRELAARVRKSGDSVLHRVGDLVRLEGAAPPAQHSVWDRIRSLFGGKGGVA